MNVIFMFFCRGLHHPMIFLIQERNYSLGHLRIMLDLHGCGFKPVNQHFFLVISGKEGYCYTTCWSIGYLFDWWSAIQVLISNCNPTLHIYIYTSLFFSSLFIKWNKYSWTNRSVKSDASVQLTADEAQHQLFRYV